MTKNVLRAKMDTTDAESTKRWVSYVENRAIKQMSFKQRRGVRILFCDRTKMDTKKTDTKRRHT